MANHLTKQKAMDRLRTSLKNMGLLDMAGIRVVFNDLLQAKFNSNQLRIVQQLVDAVAHRLCPTSGLFHAVKNEQIIRETAIQQDEFRTHLQARSVLFGDLLVGDVFRFPGDDHFCVKRSLDSFATIIEGDQMSAAKHCQPDALVRVTY
jgi:hypothetical protein